MIKYLLIGLIACLSICSFAQKNDYIWHLGSDSEPASGIQAMEINFNKDSFHIDEKTFPFGFDSNNRAICDKNGSLLFFTNGCAIMNKQYEVMPNGDTLNHSPMKEQLGWDDCNLGYPGVQNIVILPDPGNENAYYMIHKTALGLEHGFNSQLRMSYVDMELDNGLGDVVFYDSILMEEYPLSAYLEAIPHANGKDWWIIQPMRLDSVFSVFLLNETGVIRKEDQNASLYFNYWFSAASGTARFNPRGTKFVYYNRFDNLHLYDFDRTSGLLSNHKKITVFPSTLDSNDYQFGSVEWSPNGRFLYVTNRDSLYQIDTWEADLHNGIRLIDVYNGTLDPFPTTFYLMALAPDCNIYMCSTSGASSYHVINSPDEIGLNCDFVQNGIKLTRYSGSANIPLHPRFRVDANEVCDPTIASVFGQSVYYRHELNVFPNPTYGTVTMMIPEGFNAGFVEIYNSKGQLILKEEVSINVISIPIRLEQFPSDSYYIELYPDSSGAKKKYYSTKILKLKN